MERVLPNARGIVVRCSRSSLFSTPCRLGAIPDRDLRHGRSLMNGQCGAVRPSFGPSRDHQVLEGIVGGGRPGEQPDRVALTVDVEANDVALVVDAVEGRRELPIEQPDVEARPCLGFPCRVVAPCTQSSFPPHLDAQHNIRPRKRGLIRKSAFFFENLNCNNVTPGSRPRADDKGTDSRRWVVSDRRSDQTRLKTSFLLTGARGVSISAVCTLKTGP